MATPSLTPTGRLILGMIALGKQTGYDIKWLVDQATSFFWSTSYGQIYPELRRLEEQGLISGRSEPTGGRARTVYELTGAGRDALGEWLGSGISKMFEVRDEGMLRLFFSDFVSAERRLELVREIREWHQEVLDQLQALAGHPRNEGPRLTLELGTGLHQWIVDWCEAAEGRLSLQAEKE